MSTPKNNPTWLHDKFKSVRFLKFLALAMLVPLVLWLISEMIGVFDTIRGPVSRGYK